MAKSQCDFLIVGAGSAGCVLANRLSANPANRVTLIEAGGSDAHPYIRMPAGIAKLASDKRFTWDYNTEPQVELDRRRMFWPRGRVLGGSSSINAMCYIRGQAEDYDEWNRQASGWAYRDVLPWFRHSEDFAEGANAFHGDEGGLSVEPLRYRNPLTDVFLEAARQAGYADNADFNGASQEGVGNYHVTQRGGSRCSSAIAFLHPVRGRDNLTVLSRTLVRRVVIEGGRAVGVIADIDGEQTRVEAGHVILCGGAINTPQLLMLSGIGDAQALGELNIDVVADRPAVGKNLQDHLDICTLYKSKRPITYDFGAIGELAAGARYLLTGSGPGSSNAAEAGGFIRSELADDGRPDIQLHFVPAQLDDHGRNKLDGHGFTLHACFLRPFSRGEIRLASANPEAAPLIDPMYLSDERDLPRMIAGARISQEIFAQPAFEPVRGNSVFPEANSKDAQILEAYIRRKAETIYHPVGTCRMGDDDDAVVNNQLRVNDVQGLSVADASIMPELVSGNTNAPSIMIGERAADFLLAGER